MGEMINGRKEGHPWRCNVPVPKDRDRTTVLWWENDVTLFGGALRIEKSVNEWRGSIRAQGSTACRGGTC